MKVQIRTLDAKQAGEVTLNEAVFGLPVRHDILHRMVEWQRAKKQAGTHKTKTIGEISGTTSKPFKQKGTGRARQGSRRASHFVGGQTVFGPVVRSHAYKLTKKFRQLGLKTALSAKYSSGELQVIEDMQIASAKTKDLHVQLKALGLVKPLIVDVVPSEQLSLAAANIKNVNILPVVGINVLDMLRHRELVLTKAALQALEERLS